MTPIQRPDNGVITRTVEKGLWIDPGIAIFDDNVFLSLRLLLFFASFPCSLCDLRRESSGDSPLFCGTVCINFLGSFLLLS